MNQTNKSTEDDVIHPGFSELLSSPDLQERLLNSMQAGVALMEEESGKLVHLSRRLEEITGYRNDGIHNQNLRLQDLLDEKDRQRLDLHLKYPTYRNKGYYLIGNIRHEDGSYQAYYLFFSSFDTRMPGLPEITQIMFLPVNSKWDLPFTSYDSRELFLELFADFGFGTFEWNIHSDQVFWSKGIYDIYEIPYSPAPIFYEQVKAYIHPDDVRLVRTTIQRAMEQDGTYDLESRIVTSAGNVRTLHTIGKFIRDEQGTVVKLVGSMRNITDTRSQEAIMRGQVAELNRSNRELEDFAYVASHDLQEPLRKIITFSDRFSEKYKGTLDKEAGYYLERINASAENMRTLIQNLLEFSRVTRSAHKFAPVSIDRVIKAVHQELELALEETGARFVVGEMPVVEGVAAQLQQLFHNLVTNAVKFRKPDIPPLLEFSASLLSADEKVRLHLTRGNYYQVVLRDNGIGFEQEYATRIFQIFQRLHGKAEYAGSGIGLAICKKIADHHNGMIYASSTPGEGAVFTVILPEKQPQHSLL